MTTATNSLDHYKECLIGQLFQFTSIFDTYTYIVYDIESESLPDSYASYMIRGYNLDTNTKIPIVRLPGNNMIDLCDCGQTLLHLNDVTQKFKVIK